MTTVSLRALLLALASIGCSTSDPECQLVQLTPCPGCAPAEIRGGFGFDASATSIAQLADQRMVALRCGQLAFLDATYGIARDVNLRVSPASRVIVAAGAIFVEEVVLPDCRTDDEFAECEKPTKYALIGLDDRGMERWRVALGDLVRTSLVVRPIEDGVYVYSPNDTAFVPLAFDRDGNQLVYSAPSGISDGMGGTILVSYGASDASTATATISRVAADGTTQWTRTWQTTSSGTTPAISFTKIKPAPSGDIVILGSFSGSTLELGDASITPEPGDNFVALLDPTGGTQWAHAFETLENFHGNPGSMHIVQSDDRVYVGAIYTKPVDDNGARPHGIDAFVRVFGLDYTRNLDLGGPGDQYVDELYPMPNGRVGAVIQLRDDYEALSVVRIGSTTLRDDGRTYLLDLAL